MIRALVLLLAVIGAWSLLCFAIVTACIWANQRAARRAGRRTVRAWDGSEVRVVGGRRWR